jgi:protein TonB
MQRIALTATLIGLLLYSATVYAQPHKACAPIPSGKPATLCASNSAPIYPPEAKANGVQGTVVLFAQINKSGGIDWVRVVSGPEPLRQAAIDDVKLWVYRPYLIGGSPRGFRTVINVKFTLEKPANASSPNN